MIIAYAIASATGAFIGGMLCNSALRKTIKNLKSSYLLQQRLIEDLQEEVNRLTTESMLRRAEEISRESALDEEAMKAMESVKARYAGALHGLKDR